MKIKLWLNGDSAVIDMDDPDKHSDGYRYAVITEKGHTLVWREEVSL